MRAISVYDSHNRLFVTSITSSIPAAADPEGRHSPSPQRHHDGE
ncbi:MAG: hypothetical protein ACLT2V_06635 [Escherichia coli]